MTFVTSQSQPSGTAGAGRDSLHQRLAQMHRAELKPVGPLENSLVDTITHNSFQLQAAQAAERETNLWTAAGLVNLNRLARYRAVLHRSTRDALAQLRELQRRRLTPEPRVMAAGARSGFEVIPPPAAYKAAKAGGTPHSSSGPDPDPPDSPAPATPIPPRLSPCDLSSPRAARAPNR